MRTDGHDEAFRNFANAPKNRQVLNNLFDATQFKVVCARVVLRLLRIHGNVFERKISGNALVNNSSNRYVFKQQTVNSVGTDRSVNLFSRCKSILAPRDTPIIMHVPHCL